MTFDHLEFRGFLRREHRTENELRKIEHKYTHTVHTEKSFSARQKSHGGNQTRDFFLLVDNDVNLI